MFRISSIFYFRLDYDLDEVLIFAVVIVWPGVIHADVKSEFISILDPITET